MGRILIPFVIVRYEQFFYPGNAGASGFMTHEGSTGLISGETKQ
jgi:hypothetical protein